jgi:hypothetical protein
MSESIAQLTYVPATLDGLHNWLKHEYEHLGWMALSIKKGIPSRAYAFTQSLEKLGKAIQERKALDSSNAHVARDLEVLDYKLKNLVEFSKKLGIDAEVLKTQVCPAELKKIDGATAPILSVADSELSVEPKEQVGGKKLRKSPVKKTSKKASKKASKKTSKKTSKKVSKKTSRRNVKK